MPYINPDQRGGIDRAMVDLPELESEGQLNYAICMVVKEYLSWHVPNTYANYNAVIGVLECAKMEICRRLVAPYEKKKKAENGDVF